MMPHIVSPASFSSLPTIHSISRSTPLGVSTPVHELGRSDSPISYRASNQRPSWDPHYPHSADTTSGCHAMGDTSSALENNSSDPIITDTVTHPDGCSDASHARPDIQPCVKPPAPKRTSRRSSHTGLSSSTEVSLVGFHNAALSGTQSPNKTETARDTSPSSLSTSSSSTSLSSESSESSSSSSSSSSESSSSSSSSSASSPTSLSGSSARSRTRRLVPDPSDPLTKLSRTRLADSTRLSPHRSKTSLQDTSPTTKRSQNGDRKPLIRTNSESSSTPSNKVHSDTNESVWLGEHNGTTGFNRRPLSVVTTVASVIMSPARSSAASSGGLSSPGGFSGLTTDPTRVHSAFPGSMNAIPGSAVLSQISSTGHSGNHHHLPNCASVSPHAPSGEFHVFPVSVPNSSSASSGVSSCGGSFSSNNSSSGSSPFSLCNVVTSHQASVSSKLTTCTAPNLPNAHKISPTSAPIGSGLSVPVAASQLRNVTDATVRQNISHSSATDRKARVYSSENTSGLKLHISTGGNLITPHSSSSSAFCSPSSTSPLTVSIRISGSETEPNSAIPAITSPSVFSTHEDVLCVKRSGKGSNASHPTTPSSAPPHITNMDPNRRFSSQSMEMSCDKTLSDCNRAHVTDWFSLGSPVYESMYDKIKRRANKEAEERRQRQQETLDSCEKKRRKQRKKDQLARSSPSVSFTPPESFGSEHSGKTAGTNSSDKSRCCKAEKAKSDSSRKISKRSNSYVKNKIPEKEFLTNGGASDYHSSSWHSPELSQLESSWPHTGKSRPNELTPNSFHKHAHKSKRPRCEQSSISSSLSSGDECNSCSPPGTLTRLSLGMRFPVSATYHECVRLKNTHRSNWSPERDDDSLSHLSSSLSCSSSDGRSDHPPLDNSKQTATLASTFPQFHCRAYDVLGTKHGHAPSQHILKRDDCTVLHSPFTKSSYRSERELSPVRNELSSKKSQFFHAVLDRSRSTEIDKGSKPASGFKRKHEECPVKQSLKRHRTSHKFLSSEPREHVNAKNHSNHHGHSPKVPYLPDCVLVSETDDMKCSDSVLHSVGVGDQNVLRSHRSDDAYLNRRISSCLHSGTDDSSVCDTRSPSPVRGAGHSPLSLTSHYRKHYSINTSLCSDLHSRLMDDRDSIFDSFMDSDRFSTNSKSTPSTEPMEQSEMIERNLDMKFSDDEWHSSVVSTSPNPNNLEFDMDYCRGDTKTEHSSTTYQSTSFSSQLISPVCKLRSPSEDESDDESLHKAVVDFTKSCDTGDLLAPGLLHLDPVSFGLHEVSSLSAPDKKQDFITLVPEDLKMEAAVENERNIADVVSPLRPDSPITTVKLDRQSVSQPAEECLKSDQNLPALKTDNQISDGVIALEKSASSHLYDSASSTEAKTRDNTHESSVLIQESVSFEKCVDEQPERKSTNESFGTNGPCTVESSSDNSVLLEPIVPKGAIELPHITSPPVRLCNQTMEKPVGQSTPKTSSTHTAPYASVVSRVETRHSKTSADESDFAKRSSVVAPIQTPSTGTGTHAAISEPTKTITSTSSSGPPTEVHDITRYVQSVIERVKAERVEESQQAAAAAAQYHTSGAHQTLSGASCNVSQVLYSSSTARSLHDGTALGLTSANSISGKRGSANTRRPLLVATSTCTAVKYTGVTSLAKWSNSSTAGQCQSSPALTFCATGALPTVACHHPSVTYTTPVTTTISVVSSQALDPASDLHLPLIPGVNACTPLAVSPQLTIPLVTGRITRQSQQQNCSGSIRRPELAQAVGEIQSSFAKVNNTGNGQRRRRSESKASTGCVGKETINNSVSLLPSANTSLTSSESVPTQTFGSSTSGPAVAGISGKLNSMEEQAVGESVSESVQATHSTNSMGSTQKNQISVDPYEPNFDEESPVGFEHSQLHLHRSTPPICPSPTPSQPGVTSTWKQVNATTSAVASCNSPTSDPSVLSPVSNVDCEVANTQAVSVNADSAPVTNTNGSTSTTVHSPVAAPVTSDSVDEVIRDVCAGQFDVSSYMNSWRTEHSSNTNRQVIKNSPRIIVQSQSGPLANTAINSSVTTTATPIVSNITNPAITSATVNCTPAPTPVSSIVVTVPTSTPTVTVSNNTSTLSMVVPTSLVSSVSSSAASITKLTTNPIPNMAKSFPLAISEPVVAAVTIPVNSNGAKNITPGKNGSSNVVNIATGNALLNTLLAALQRIPGSQVTVGGVGSGAISATTITLPVNAARQAAANITVCLSDKFYFSEFINSWTQQQKFCLSYMISLFSCVGSFYPFMEFFGFQFPVVIIS